MKVFLLLLSILLVLSQAFVQKDVKFLDLNEPVNNQTVTETKPKTQELIMTPNESFDLSPASV